MPTGDTVSALSSVNSGAYIAMQPASGVEWIIHNVSFSNSIELYYFDGTNEIRVDSETGNGSLRREALHCTNSRYYRIKNVFGSAALIGYDGVISKE